MRTPLAALVLSAPAAALAQSPVAMGVDVGSSVLKEICLDPCDCIPRWFRGRVDGGFTRTFVGADPLFARFDLDGVRITVAFEDHDEVIFGSGRYIVGGEVAVQHRLWLTAEIEGQVWHFDSGLVLFEARTFPAIDITAATTDVSCTRYTLTLRSSPSCPADFNADGFVDFFDYDGFVACFEALGCPPGTTADVNADGFVDFFDYDAFVTSFEVGC
jgi:hypothetical protein